jgi:hypothetical protein
VWFSRCSVSIPEAPYFLTDAPEMLDGLTSSFTMS